MLVANAKVNKFHHFKFKILYLLQKKIVRLGGSCSSDIDCASGLQCTGTCNSIKSGKWFFVNEAKS